jgi:hypothetical protein
MGHPGQGIRKCLWGKIPSNRNFVELKIYEIWEEESSCGNEGKAILVEWRVRRRGPHRKVLGRVSCSYLGTEE